jgi:diguanylate cyclase (GGDEF)-like protein
MIVFDIDDMKGLNDYNGLTCGDYLIGEVASLLAKNIPTNALLARSGGDEFTLVLPRTTKESAEQLAQLLCDLTAATTIPFKYQHEEEFRQIAVAMSAGVAEVQTNVPDPTPMLMYRIVSNAYESLRYHKAQRRKRQATSQPSASKSSADPLNSSPAGPRRRIFSLNRILRKS